MENIYVTELGALKLGCCTSVTYFGSIKTTTHMFDDPSFIILEVVGPNHQGVFESTNVKSFKEIRITEELKDKHREKEM